MPVRYSAEGLCARNVPLHFGFMVVCIGVVLCILLAVYAALKPYPADYDVDGKLIVDGAKMARDTFRAVGYTLGILAGWILERRFVNFSTNIALPI